MVEGKKVVAIIQARMTSSRQPGKVMLDLKGKPVLHRVIDRARSASLLDQVWVATSTHPFDDVVERAAKAYGAPVHRGPLDDVLARYAETAQAARADIIVRITCDNPLTEYRFIDLGVERLVKDGLDYLTFTRIPHGAHVWVFTRQALRKENQLAKDPYDREHVCTFFLKNPDRFKSLEWECPIPALRRPDARITLDTLEDFVLLDKVFSRLGRLDPIPLEEALAVLDSMPCNET